MNSEISYEQSKLDNKLKGRAQAKDIQGAYTGVDKETEDEMAISDMSKKGQWIFYAVTSGGCAAVNGVFAKL